MQPVYVRPTFVEQLAYDEGSIDKSATTGLQDTRMQQGIHGVERKQNAGPNDTSQVEPIIAEW